ncbi:hypothetical protein ABIE59_004041 [Marinobacter sp. MBR-99]|jgi:hypothetical protein
MGIKGMMFTSAECLRELGLLFRHLSKNYFTLIDWLRASMQAA